MQGTDLETRPREKQKAAERSLSVANADEAAHGAHIIGIMLCRLFGTVEELLVKLAKPSEKCWDRECRASGADKYLGKH